MAGLTPEARARIDEITRLIVEKLLLTPTEQLKAVNDDAVAAAHAEALHRLFALSSTTEERPDTPPEPFVPGARRR